MVNLKTVKERCFAELSVGCKILTCDCMGKDKCPFYKPESCEDWIRIERNGEAYILPPEEYYEM